MLKMTEEPKDAKKRTKAYAKENPGLYALKKIEMVEIYFTGRIDKND